MIVFKGPNCGGCYLEPPFFLSPMSPVVLKTCSNFSSPFSPVWRIKRGVGEICLVYLIFYRQGFLFNTHFCSNYVLNCMRWLILPQQNIICVCILSIFWKKKIFIKAALLELRPNNYFAVPKFTTSFRLPPVSELTVRRFLPSFPSPLSPSPLSLHA